MCYGCRNLHTLIFDDYLPQNIIFGINSSAAHDCLYRWESSTRFVAGQKYEPQAYCELTQQIEEKCHYA